MKVFSAISLVVALGGFLLSFAISFQAVGLSQGLTIGEAQLEEHRIRKGEKIIHVSGQGYETYDRVATYYGNVSFFFLLIVSLFIIYVIFRDRFRTLVPISCVVLSAIIANILRYELRGKAFMEEGILEAPRNTLLKLTITYDWFLLFLVSIIVISSVAIVIWSSIQDRYATS